MKIQDIAFIVVFVVLILKRNPIFAAYAGIISLVLSIPLFTFWIFFTAQRLVMYAAAFFLLSLIFHIIDLRTEK